MPALAETQRKVLDALFGRTERDAAVRLLRHTPQLAAGRRLQIYRNNLFEGLTAALEAVFPVVAQLVGAGFFRQLARDYVVAHPSRSGNLHEFGRDLPAAIAQLPSLAGLPYLADVAALEWACHEVYHEADHVPLAPDRLAAVSPAQQMRLRLHLAPAARFVASRYPVLRIWQSHQSDTADDGSPISLDAGGVRLLVARCDLDIEFRMLGGAEDLWLRALAAGTTLCEATASALALDPAFDLANALGRHLSLGSFSGLSLAAQDAPTEKVRP
jgi:hypothetical protein